MKTFWDERYGIQDFVYGKSPNDFFKQQLSLLKPGKLLLPCEGEGRNAVYAATECWQVDAFDQSEVGRKKAMLLAEEYNVSINYFINDATTVDVGENKYDVVALIYAHFAADTRKSIHRHLIKALKKSGIIILEAFNSFQQKNSSGGPKDINMLYTREMLAEDFRELDIRSNEYVRVNLQEGSFHKGVADVIRFVAKKN
ncbi:MAG TPA: class I SAM-dependent methyltransferase [Puia sp.]|nr:class I SAM-dependent methyltransferase [Puia sp.]